MTGRTRLALFVAVCVLVVGGTAGYLVWRATQRDDVPAGTPVPAIADSAAFEGAARIVFRNTAIGPDYGRVAMVAADDPGGPRALTGTDCQRVDAAAATTLCLLSNAGITSTYVEQALSADGAVQFGTERAGIPSRARLSADGRIAAITGFVTGDSYLTAGFSTRTYITSLDDGTSLHLEDFQLLQDGEPIFPVDRNFWGVTFADDDTFYVTASFGGEPWLARGSIGARTVETVRPGAECPSLSPDGTRVAYKKRRDDGWGLAVLDLASGVETALPEDRSVDDQVEWLDDATVLYALPLTGERGGEFDVWALPVDGTGGPRLLIGQASSPSVIR